MSAHTPGPWSKADIKRKGNHVYWRIEAPSKNVAGVSMDVAVYKGDVKEVADEMKANARLIAAAPDLLEACESLVALLGKRVFIGGDSAETTLGPMRAAIAKARGEQ